MKGRRVSQRLEDRESDPPSDLRLFGRRSSSNVQKVLWLLGEMDICYIHEEFGGVMGGHHGPDYLRINPNGTIPTIVTDNVSIWESNTIMRYLCNRFGPTPLYPTDPVSRADCEMWMDWQLGSFSSTVGPLYVELVRTAPEDRNNQQIALLANKAARLCKLIDSELQNRAYMACDSFTLADISVGIPVGRWLSLITSDVRGMPHLASWHERLSVRRAYREKLEPSLF